MVKTVAFATLLAASCSVNAAATWNFSYTGFLQEDTGIFDGSRSLNGSFSGRDMNRDGYLDRTEISSFFLNGTDYIGCASSSNEFYKCGTDNFLYKIGGKLEFSAGFNSTDPEGLFSGGHYFTAGDRDLDYQMTPYSYAEASYLWTDETAFSIRRGAKFQSRALEGSMAMAMPVPEPGTWAMLAGGLLVVTGAARRRRGNAAAKLG
ncbi:PEP-CTERM sorting domain-containing protein [Massilia sp. METH4]|uniref:PEP-CTERM sorting domain-containing protein n=1 Tax=Massilia sp. METH4 TaxID=3123041 RepID=UPI0030CCCACB